MKLTKILVLVLPEGAIAAYFTLDLGQYLSLPYLKDKLYTFQAYCAENPVKAIGAYFLLYVLLAALSIPGATIATLAGGVQFDRWLGTAIVLFAASIGATMAFLVSRHLVQHWVRNRFRTQFDVVAERFSRDCVLYLLTLRLVLLFSFFIVNLLVGLITMRIWPLYWASLLGMMTGTVIRVNAGTQLGQIAEWHNVMSWQLLASMVLLAFSRSRPRSQSTCKSSAKPTPSPILDR